MGPGPGADAALERATAHALRWLGSLATRRVPSSATADDVAAVERGPGRRRPRQERGTKQ